MCLYLRNRAILQSEDLYSEWGKDLKLKKGILVAVISRESRLIIPEGGDSLQAGDKIILISRGLPILDINDIFAD